MSLFRKNQTPVSEKSTFCLYLALSCKRNPAGGPWLSSELKNQVEAHGSLLQNSDKHATFEVKEEVFEKEDLDTHLIWLVRLIRQIRKKKQMIIRTNKKRENETIYFKNRQNLKMSTKIFMLTMSRRKKENRTQNHCSWIARLRPHSGPYAKSKTKRNKFQVRSKFHKNKN